MTTCKVIRSGEAYRGQQGLTYLSGLTGATAGSRSICMTMVELPPGARAKAHLHRGIETAVYVIDGEAAMYFGERLGEMLVARGGEYVYSWLGYPLTYMVDGKKKVSEVLSTHTLAPIHNADRLPVVISIGCSTAYFVPLGPNEPYVDTSGRAHAGEAHKEVVTGPPAPPSPYQPGKLGKDSLGKQLLEDGPNGAVAYVGSDMVAQPMALTLLDGFIASLRASSEPHVGDSWTAAVRHFYEAAGIARMEPDGDWVKPATFAQAMKFNLFDDPSLPMAGGK